MSRNGRLTDGELTWIYGVQLANVTAQAFRNMSNAYFAATGRYLSIALPAGGYRSFWLQGDMRTNPNRWSLYNLSRISIIPLASPGTSNHGLGLCADVADWAAAKAWVLANMHRFGFTRPFGIRDPNHLLHNGRTTGPGTLAPAGTITHPLEDTLSAAEVNDIKNHVTSEANRVLAEVKAVRATQLAHQNLFVEEVNAVGNGHVPGGIRGLIVNGIAVSQVNQNLLAVENGGGIRSMISTVIGLLQRLVQKLGA
jgi:hypothetical protein